MKRQQTRPQRQDAARHDVQAVDEPPDQCAVQVRTVRHVLPLQQPQHHKTQHHVPNQQDLSHRHALQPPRQSPLARHNGQPFVQHQPHAQKHHQRPRPWHVVPSLFRLPLHQRERLVQRPIHQQDDHRNHHSLEVQQLAPPLAHKVVLLAKRCRQRISVQVGIHHLADEK